MTAPLDPAGWISSRFPGWRGWVSQTGRWWAMDESALTAGQVSAGCLPLLHAEDAAALAARIQAQETLRHQHPAHRLISLPDNGIQPGRGWSPDSAP